ncbi:low molecular weight protein-tyrosine-phosphatase [Nocardioides caldifontis]|uniref:low molecular weight protein-tyrosine-phosphatase n=1 Tax=Nocardioides caldifontis TaxID=2588938 RepID=UPI0011DFA7D7|nr:low molecular weight protein-tyrosine-phosphatase [Nocardioides caldifontis]
MTDLPPPRNPGSYSIAVVCLGNICRSPMAHVVLSAAIADAGLDDRVEVVSAGTGDWHVGGPMDRRAAAVLTSHGYDATRHRAQQFQPSWHDEHDLVLAMDAQNHADLRELATDLAGTEERLRLFRDFDPLADDGDRDVPDPYYGGDEGFDHVMSIVRRTSDALVDRLARVVN